MDPEHVGQALGTLSELDDETLGTLLPTHGFAVDCIARLRNGDRVGLLKSRRDTLIAGERKFMAERDVKLPTELTAATIADSETSDEE